MQRTERDNLIKRLDESGVPHIVKAGNTIYGSCKPIGHLDGVYL